MHDIDSLNQQFSIPGHITFTRKSGGLALANIDNGLACAEITLQGAHLIGWRPHGTAPVIWLSENARFETGKAIRGGIPVCWPWFGFHEQDASQPAHGFARTSLWEVGSTQALPDGSTRIVLTLARGPSTPAIWPHPFRLDYIITVGRELRLELKTENTGNSPFCISEALHTYFAVGDIDNTRVHGLAGCSYADKADGMARKLEPGAVIVQSEVDRIYLDTERDCRIEDQLQQRSIEISTEGSRTTVIWNPWQAKAEQMGDMGEQGYRTMICVESANALENSVTITPGNHHSLIARYLVPL